MVKLYLFETKTTTQAKNYWIDDNFIPIIKVTAETQKEALKKYFDIVEDNYFMKISKTTRKKQEPIYRDFENLSTQVGYIFKGLTEIDNKKIYCDLWIEIYQNNLED